MDHNNSENLENSKGKGEEEKEIYASLYFNALRQQLESYDTGDCTQFEEMEEEILEEIDEVVEEHLEEVRPDLVIKRIKGLQFLIIDRDRYEKKRDQEE